MFLYIDIFYSLQDMALSTDITESLIKQLKVIRNAHGKWQDVVRESGEIFTSLAYNLMREQRIIDSGNRDESAWSVKQVSPIVTTKHLPRYLQAL